MDEAGSPLAAAELSFQLLGWPRSFFLPAPSPSPLRNLTLGVLIVTGGTLAALPFRRSPAIPDASTNVTQSPTQATGTLESALDLAPVHAVASSGNQPRVNSVNPFSRQEIPGLDEFIRDESLARPSDFVASDQSRSSIKPLTYEDLMAPITRPESIQDRYQAIAAVGSDMRPHRQQLAMELPPVEQLAPELGNELQQRFTAMSPSQISQPASILPSSTDRAGGSLASSSIPRSMIPRTPTLPELSQAPVVAEPSQRQHHWIVQP